MNEKWRLMVGYAGLEIKYPWSEENGRTFVKGLMLLLFIERQHLKIIFSHVHV